MVGQKLKLSYKLKQGIRDANHYMLLTIKIDPLPLSLPHYFVHQLFSISYPKCSAKFFLCLFFWNIIVSEKSTFS